jgi:hypothetical protein
MDKPRHPLVIRPWKIQQTKRTKPNPPPIADRCRSRTDKPGAAKHG